MKKTYEQFLKDKVCIAPGFGYDIADSEVNPILKPHQRDIVRWAVKGGRRAIFTAFGLGKTVIQLETVRLMLKHSGENRGLIILPLGVRQLSMEGETVFDPFAGLGTVPMRAVLQKRFGYGCELSPMYFNDAIHYLRQAEADASMPTLFDLEELELCDSVEVVG